MKHTPKLILLSALLFALLTTGCPQSGKHSGKKNQGVNPALPQNPYELTESDVLTAFGLRRGNITASAAAKKIATDTPASGITFTERNFIAYDDQTGMFTVKIKGLKNGKTFDKTLTLAGFTHPLDGKLIQSVDSCELNLDEGIEHNYSLGKYIREVNKDPSGTKLVRKLSFMLSDSVTPIKLGEHDSYTLTAKAQEFGTHVWVRPSVKIVFRKLTEGGTETLTTSTPFGFTHLKPSLTKDYFEAKDVFQYILDKTADTAIKVDSTEFASYFYAGAKKTEQAPENLFTDVFKAAVKKYTDLYQTKDTDELLAIDKITYGIAQPKNGGIDADDYTGTVTVDLCIATSEQVTAQTGITAIKQIKKSGFASIPDDAALAKKNHLFFHLIPKGSLTDASKAQWEQKSFSNHPLFRVDKNTGTGAINNPFTAADNPFSLSVNGSDNNLSSHLGCAVFGASKTRHNKVIFIENIQLQKEANSKFMTVQVKLKGSGGILEVPADPGY